MGIAKYNEECHGVVQRYVGEWEKTVVRMGRWINFRNDYKTMDLKYMESVWWGFAQLYKKELVYKGFKVMPYSICCKSPLSNFEANSNYKETSDPEIMVAFTVVDDADGASLVAWTTTPWTLPCNLLLCVNAGFVYVMVRNKFNGKVFVVAEFRLSELAIPIEKAKKSSVVENSNSNWNTYKILDKFSGASLVGEKYVPLFNYFKDHSDFAFKVAEDSYVGVLESFTVLLHLGKTITVFILTRA